MTQISEAEPVHYHDCPALGKHTRTIEATTLSTDGRILLGHQLKCPFCLVTGGNFRPAPGVTVIRPGQYTVDMTKAILTEPG